MIAGPVSAFSCLGPVQHRQYRAALRSRPLSSLPALPVYLEEEVFSYAGTHAHVVQVGAWPSTSTLRPSLGTPAATSVTAFVLCQLQGVSYDSFPVLTPVEIACQSQEWDERAMELQEGTLDRQKLGALRESGYRFPTSLDPDVVRFGTPPPAGQIPERLKRLRPEVRRVLQGALDLCAELQTLHIPSLQEANAATEEYLDRCHSDPLYLGSIAQGPYLDVAVRHDHDAVQQGAYTPIPVSIWNEDDPAYRAYRRVLPKKVRLVQAVLELLST